MGDYAARGAEHAARARSTARTVRRIGVARLASFVVLAGVVAAGMAGRLSPAAAWSLAVATTIAFAALVGVHRRFAERLRIDRSLEQACSNGAARVLRQWDLLPPAPVLEYPVDHAFAADLHLTGTQSLLRLLPALSPTAGLPTISDWLLAESPPAADVVRRRQASVAELVPRTQWRERLSVFASRVTGTTSGFDTFARWAESVAPSSRRRVIQWVARLSTIVTLPVVIAAVAHLAPVWLAAALVIFNLSLAALAREELSDSIGGARSGRFRLDGHALLLRHVQDESFESSELSALANRAGGSESSRAFGRLEQLLACSELRYSPMGHVVLQALVLWDIHVAAALDAWRRRYGPALREWMHALGEIEGLAALAALAHDNPTWCAPDVRANDDGTIDARSLAHPLLPASIRVANDVAVGPRGTILLVTGSNMAGKTTLLRAIGLNVILAQMGAPVCAASMALSRFRLRTSMQAIDSLERGLSLFMAELTRLKSIVDAARVSSDSTLLYLADEILRGTNAADRHTAVAAVLGGLADAGAVGVVATHDPDLVDVPALAQRTRAVSLIERFRHEAGSPVMWFDYRIRPGVATTRNALELLRIVGLTDSPPA